MRRACGAGWPGRLLATGLSCALVALSVPAGGRALAADPSANAGRPVPPLRLSETGLYAADGSVAAANRPFAPQYPLWTDGAGKTRWVHLPEEAKIDVSDVDAWRFPVGTRFWKEFSWGDRKVETRMIWQPADGEWAFASYVWNDEQTDALLAPGEGVPGVYEFAPGKRHGVPSVADCQVCHRSSRAVALGFDALQLSDDRDPLAPHAEPLPAGALTLRSLVESGRLDPARPELASEPPRIRAADPTARAALGYLSANCGSCHNAAGPLSRLGLVLQHDVAGRRDAPEPAVRSAVDVPGRFVPRGVSPESARLVSPGAPESSTLLHRMGSRQPTSQMPPLGSVLADAEALALVRRWIEGLGPPDEVLGDAAAAAR